MLVITLLAVVVGMATLALRDSNASRLEEEVARLYALFEGARGRSRATRGEVRGLPRRDSLPIRLEEEVARLSALLEGARARSRATGVEVRWLPRGEDGKGFVFQGLPAEAGLPAAWLDERTTAQIIGSPFVRLGPEPLIGAQRVVLRLEDRALVLATDGMGPFLVSPEPAP